MEEIVNKSIIDTTQNLSCALFPSNTSLRRKLEEIIIAKLRISQYNIGRNQIAEKSNDGGDWRV